MTLYSADVFDLAKPVAKKGKGKKAATPAVEVPEPSAAPDVETVQTKPVKEKKPPTEKQLVSTMDRAKRTVRVRAV